MGNVRSANLTGVVQWTTGHAEGEAAGDKKDREAWLCCLVNWCLWGSTATGRAVKGVNSFPWRSVLGWKGWCSIISYTAWLTIIPWSTGAVSMVLMIPTLISLGQALRQHNVHSAKRPGAISSRAKSCDNTWRKAFHLGQGWWVQLIIPPTPQSHVKIMDRNIT